MVEFGKTLQLKKYPVLGIFIVVKILSILLVAIFGV